MIESSSLTMQWEMLGGANGSKGKSLQFHIQLIWKKKFSFQTYNEAECQRKVTCLKGTDSLTVKGERRRQVLPMTLELNFLRQRETRSKINVMPDTFYFPWKPLGEHFKQFAFQTFFLIK